ncbi:esterase [Listeria newyorkensis]|uniref:Esterase n=1 Tax=Listeria newyorkensis TaxID=1497681 RepID=A0ABX4XP70_9LIST|nr:alpha/beta hydrolase family protein [Listeria newyorkensis]KGL44167.1 esterase [Listeria newyorkensis]KMT61557.1 esterase family protein [Listeria newyorkensis]PNP93111.1 esterase [Listeria newyorkensis]WAO21734.1 alpha/beta hydrolase family protein [Listeria newyorkensis]SQC57783.1 Mycolyl transferase 85A [Listeria newyorkensis]
MALFSTHFVSESLQLRTSLQVFVPDQIDTEKPMRLLYLLHGLSDDDTAWLTNTSLVRYAENRNIAIVMPQVHRSFYTDMHVGNRYWTFLSEELPSLIHSWFKLPTEPENTYVAGLSMGGYGAFKWALHYSEKFAGMASLSGALDIVALREARPEGESEMQATFGDIETHRGSDNDLLALLDKVTAKPRVLQLCGTEDFLYDNNLGFKSRIEQTDLPYTYQESPGEHNWEYWNREIQTVLNWIDRKGDFA